MYVFLLAKSFNWFKAEIFKTFFFKYCRFKQNKT